jgi:hypothetical protein
MSKKKSKQKKHHPQVHQTGTNEEEKGTIMQISGSVEVKRSHHLQTQIEAERKDDNTQASKEYGLARIALVSGIVYSALTLCIVIIGICSYRSASNANTIALTAIQTSKDQFRFDQRPYIWMATKEPFGNPVLVKEGSYAGYLEMAMNFENHGKSPALKVREDAHISIGEEAWKKVTWNEISQQEGSLMPPGPGLSNFVYSDEKVDGLTFKTIMTGRIPIIVWGHFEYTDTYESPQITYVSEFCQIRLFIKAEVPKIPIGDMENGVCKSHNGFRIKQH